MEIFKKKKTSPNFLNSFCLLASQEHSFRKRLSLLSLSHLNAHLARHSTNVTVTIREIRRIRGLWSRQEFANSLFIPKPQTEVARYRWKTGANINHNPLIDHDCRHVSKLGRSVFLGPGAAQRRMCACCSLTHGWEDAYGKGRPE